MSENNNGEERVTGEHANNEGNNTISEDKVVVEVNLDDDIIVSNILSSNGNAFITKHQDKIKLINSRVIDVIKSSNITINTENISVSETLRIVSSITKAINNIKELKTELESLPAGEKAGVLFAVTVEVINSPEVSAHISPNIREKILDFTENGEAVNEVAQIVDWIGDEVLSGYDTNNDGIVTSLEIEDDCVGCCICANRCGNGKNGCNCYQKKGCCGCCPGFARKIAKCWSAFFINFLCCQCGKKQVQYIEN